MKTDLKKILTISGQQGLFKYISQAKNGAVVESIVDGHRTSFGINVKMNSLEDIAIYTNEGEVKLREVFEKMHTELKEEDAPSGKSEANVLKGFFEKVLPDYDKDRFYVSHMKKVVEWYNCLKKYASLDFENE
jgi:hypothetical protein